MSETVIVLHGVWMRRPTLWPLARRLRVAGFGVRTFGYSSLWQPPGEAMQRLAQRMADAGEDGPVHLVGHSLGGLIALETLNAFTDLPDGRVVCLGSPLAGSSAARAMARMHVDGLLGQSRTLLKSGLYQLPPLRSVGVLAGASPMGFGQWLARFDGVHDGSVAVWETRLPGLADHLVLPVSHSGMLFSGLVAQCTIAFLQTGHFRP
jgi:pimeloyl-ACP methyl ester carboxylesterase